MTLLFSLHQGLRFCKIKGITDTICCLEIAIPIFRPSCPCVGSPLSSRQLRFHPPPFSPQQWHMRKERRDRKIDLPSKEAVEKNGVRKHDALSWKCSLVAFAYHQISFRELPQYTGLSNVHCFKKRSSFAPPCSDRRRPYRNARLFKKIPPLARISMFPFFLLSAPASRSSLRCRINWVTRALRTSTNPTTLLPASQSHILTLILHEVECAYIFLGEQSESVDVAEM